jgi:hypothetical protein
MDDGPNIDLIVPRSEEIPDFYQAAEQMGFHALWFTETLFSQAQAIQRRTSPGWTFLGPEDGDVREFGFDIVICRGDSEPRHSFPRAVERGIVPASLARRRHIGRPPAKDRCPF